MSSHWNCVNANPTPACPATQKEPPMKLCPLAVGATLAAALLAPLAAHAQTTHTYTGNGATGFSGYLGQGHLTITRDTQNNLTFSLAPHGGNLGGAGVANGVALYIDSEPGGFADTSALSDNGDPGHEIISGANTGANSKINGKNPPSRSLVTFAPGFKADYALSIEGSYVGLFKLAVGKDNSLVYISGAGQTNAPYTITIPGSKIGVKPGQSFKFVGTLISAANAYRSNETLGSTAQGTAGPVPGFNGRVMFTGFDTFPTVAR